MCGLITGVNKLRVKGTSSTTVAVSKVTLEFLVYGLQPDMQIFKCLQHALFSLSLCYCLGGTLGSVSIILSMYKCKPYAQDLSLNFVCLNCSRRHTPYSKMTAILVFFCFLAD